MKTWASVHFSPRSRGKMTSFGRFHYPLSHLWGLCLSHHSRRKQPDPKTGASCLPDHSHGLLPIFFKGQFPRESFVRAWEFQFRPIKHGVRGSKRLATDLKFSVPSLEYRSSLAFRERLHASWRCFIACNHIRDPGMIGICRSKALVTRISTFIPFRYRFVDISPYSILVENADILTCRLVKACILNKFHSASKYDT